MINNKRKWEKMDLRDYKAVLLAGDDGALRCKMHKLMQWGNVIFSKALDIWHSGWDSASGHPKLPPLCGHPKSYHGHPKYSIWISQTHHVGNPKPTVGVPKLQCGHPKPPLGIPNSTVWISQTSPLISHDLLWVSNATMWASQTSTGHPKLPPWMVPNATVGIPNFSLGYPKTCYGCPKATMWASQISTRYSKLPPWVYKNHLWVSQRYYVAPIVGHTIHTPGVPPFFRFTVKLPQFITYALHPNGKGAPVSIGPLVWKLAWSRSTICVGVSPIGASL
ncbi:hypothetical protein BU15DRAFT_63555 [Melanogaster broomeanus]|nr:hypothetical protein BU15DRAFT_63555 [Melanogaster broomeanus]